MHNIATVSEAPSLEALIGSTVGEKYELRRLLGVGGMGAVYEALNRWTGRKVALKLMLQSHAQHPEQVERFLREARAASKIQHASIVQVLDVGRQPDGSFFLIQELLEGKPLKTLLDLCVQLSPKDARSLLLPVLEGLAEAHENGVVHRDLKPDNLFVVERVGAAQQVKVIDFGIAKLTEHDGESLSVTRTGTAIGTPLYMSPEQARGERSVGPQSDVWSMGIVLFECLTGRCPFLGESYNEVLAKILTQRAPRLDRLAPGMPSGVCDVVAKALEPGRQDRFANMKAFAEAVRDCSDFAVDRVFTAVSSVDPRSRSAAEGFDSGALHNDATIDARAPRSNSRPSGSAPTESVSSPTPSTAALVEPAATRDAAVAGGETAPATPSESVAAEAKPPRAPVVAATMSGMVVQAEPARRRLSSQRAVIAGALSLFVVVGAGALVGRGRSSAGATVGPQLTTQSTPQNSGPREAQRGAQPAITMPFSAAISVDPPNATIEIDGRVVGMGAFAGNFLADGTAHTLRVRADGYQPMVIEFRDAPPPPRVALVRVAGVARPNTARPRGIGAAPAQRATTNTSAQQTSTQGTARGPMQRAYE